MKTSTKAFFFIFFILVSLCFAQVPRRINYQGKLTDAGEVALTGTHTIIFKIWKHETSTAPSDSLWAEERSVVITNGLFDIQLGDVEEIALTFDEPYWIELIVDGETLVPREKLATVSYAFRSVYADTASYVVGGGPSTSDYVQNQRDSIQNGDFRISNEGEVGFLQIKPNTPDSTITPEAGMIRTLGSGSEYGMFTHDGACWRQFFPSIDTTTCFGGAFSVYAGADTTIDSGTNATLAADATGGWSPYDYDWDNDGTGDWDDLQTIVVSPTVTTTYNVQVRDVTEAIASDAVIVNVTVPSTPFAIAVGGTGADYCKSVVQTSDEGYAMVGYTESFGAGGRDILFTKLSASGALQWARVVGGTSNDYGMSVVQASDGGYTVAGYTESFGSGNRDVFLLKFSSAGALEWSRVVGGSGHDTANSIVQTSDGGYATTGYTYSYGAGNSDAFLVKFSSTGSLEWARAVGGSRYDLGFQVSQTSDGGYFVAGYNEIWGSGSKDFYLIKLNSSGSMQWSRAVGGVSTNNWGYAGVPTSDGGYIITGRTDHYGAGGRDIYVVKVSSTGTRQWTRTIGGSSDDYANSIIQTSDGGYVLAARTASYGAGGNDLFLVKLSSAGALEWSRAVGGTGHEYGLSVVETSDGGYAVAGQTYSFGAGSNDFILIKFDSDGNSCIGSSISPSFGTPGDGESGISPSVASPSPTVTSASPTTTGISPTVTEICP